MPTAKLYIRCSISNGRYLYASAVYAANGRLKPHIGLVDGKPQHYPDATYDVRYTSMGKRIWEPASNDPSLAVLTLQRRNHALQVAALGMDTAPVAGIAPVQQPISAIPKRSIRDAVAEYLTETAAHKSVKTLASYAAPLNSFLLICRRENLEDLTREDILAYALALRTRGNAPRTVGNRIDALKIFLHHYKIPSLLTGKDLPKYTEKQVRAYNRTELDKMLKVADQEEFDLLHFFLCFGLQEQETQYACWTDADLIRKS